MGAEYLSYVKFIATEAPTFFGYIISVLAMVFSAFLEDFVLTNTFRQQPILLSFNQLGQCKMQGL